MLSFFIAAHLATTTVHARIEQTFGANSPMIEIARCESGLRQFKAPSVVLRNPVTPDVGVFQINVDYHLATAKKMGINIYSLDGNIAYAKYLYDKNGVRDWTASKPCWAKKGIMKG